MKALNPAEREKLLTRSSLGIESVKARVDEILRGVKQRGDKALVEYTALFDKVKLEPSEIRVSEDEVKAAYEKTPEKLISALRSTAASLEVYHRAQMPPNTAPVQTREGVSLRDIWRPITTVGAYAPRRLPSTCLMITVPGKVAGVQRMIACTPPSPERKLESVMLTALDMGGVDAIYRVGGAQAVAAMAYGTETVPRVEKIVGPGNIYVTAAKLLIQGLVGTDLPAGPSEILILADETADPSIVALDLLSQLEHGKVSASESYAALVTTSRKLASKVAQSLAELVSGRDAESSRAERLGENISILTCEGINEAVAFVNAYAPEHLEVIAENPESILSKVNNAGSVFIGPFSPAAAGDYATGANHVLPTGGAARFTSGLSVYDYMKRITVQEVTRGGLAKMLDLVAALAEAEGLRRHVEAVRARVR
ncbi:MAG: histidinol dehydrogenase [Candidatus Bathyarchaeia archaeon]